MAAITFNTAHQAEHIRQQLETALAAFREMLDTFVSNRMRQAAAEAEHARRGSSSARDRNRKTRNDRHAADMPRSFAAASARTFDRCDRAERRTPRHRAGR